MFKNLNKQNSIFFYKYFYKNHLNTKILETARLPFNKTTKGDFYSLAVKSLILSNYR